MTDEISSDEPENGSDGDDNNNENSNVSTGGDFVRVKLEDEMRHSYLGYALSVIVGRALPDVRDGLKPVHRRSLYGMDKLNNRHDRPPMKSARISGEVMGKYHPHGEDAIYNTIVIMAQDFKMRYPLVDGQGNFGSIDGDPPAASRYTEVRMSKIASELLADLDKETVDMVRNYDETLWMPVVLPTRVPNLLINGSQGIAVGMSTNIPPHNIGEIIGASIALLKDSALGVMDLMEHVPGPDFPTAGIINGRRGIVDAYETGRGRIIVRGRANIEEDKSGRQRIIITEIPFQVNKATLVESIAQLVRDQRITGISDLRDESNKDGLRVVVEIKKSEMGDVVLNNLYTHTQLQTSFSVNAVALVNGQPKVVSLKDMLLEFIQHRREVVIRRTVYLLREGRKRAHLLEGQTVALAEIDEIVELIRKSESRDVARTGLMERAWLIRTPDLSITEDQLSRIEAVRSLLQREDVKIAQRQDLPLELGFDLTTLSYRFSQEQADAILNLQLHRLVSMEQNKLIDDFEELITTIRNLQRILDSDERLDEVIEEELTEIKEKFADDRKTEIREAEADFSVIDLINPMYVVLTISHAGYAKAQDVDVYRAQHRGGHGKIALSTKESDYVEQLMVVHNHSTLLCFSNLGRVHWLPAYRIPVESRNARGKPLVNLIKLQPDERITTVVPMDDDPEDKFVAMATKNGRIKRTQLTHFVQPRKLGKIAITLEDDDELVGVAVTDGTKKLMLVQSAGFASMFQESDVRAQGRSARGVRGIRLAKDEKVLAFIVPEEDGFLLCASENGFGKCSRIDSFRLTRRNGKGVKAIKSSVRNGALACALQVVDDDEVMFINDRGVLLRTKVSQISKVGRVAQGVKLLDLKDGAKLVGGARIPTDEELVLQDSLDTSDETETEIDENTEE
ncbi:MAG: DNA gyrase subunit A [Gammaproteobacteria bacterium]|nr:DNA gyrase subunit A [Gammaproteobacteria bacterium]